MTKFVSLDTFDVRFPTSRSLAGSDAMNPTPDYALAYAVVRTNADDGREGHGFAFTIGRGNDVELAAIRALEPFIVGFDVEETLADLGGFARGLVWDSPLRWLGPEKGVMHMAIGAVVNALWDLRAKRAGKPLWRLLVDLSPEELTGLIDFRYLSDALTADEAVELLAKGANGREERTIELETKGLPAYTTSAGWLGYDDDQLISLSSEAALSGFSLVKLKVGANQEDDLRRCGLVRSAIGAGVGLALDANQVWDVNVSVDRINALREFELSWVEEPTNPDDILGLARIKRGIAPIRVASGEHVPNRVVFKQLLQHRSIDIMQIDACRVAGVNENVANLLLAAKFGVPVYPHAGGVGLCELVQHLAMFDYISLGGLSSRKNFDPLIEWIDHLHDHFVEPATIVSGRYRVPELPGASTQMRAESIDEFSFPVGKAWIGELADPEAGTGDLNRVGGRHPGGLAW